MPFEKVLVQSPALSVSVAEAAGEVKLVVAIGALAGGGDVAGFAKVKGSIEADVEAQVLIDAGLALAKAKFPSLGGAFDMAKALIDAELAKA